jgi:hypothetical protein
MCFAFSHSVSLFRGKIFGEPNDNANQIKQSVNRIAKKLAFLGCRSAKKLAFWIAEPFGFRK